MGGIRSGRRRWRTLTRKLDRVLIRSLNVWVALVGILVTLPIMAVVAVAVRLSSPGPIVYRQPRVGRNRRRGRSPQDGTERRTRNVGGKVFTLYKFRTMRYRPDADAQWAEVTDPRVTRVGRFLRRHHLDELPQLFNVLIGEMNIVGPRPEQPELFTEIRDRVERFGRRQYVLPGITGLAQIELPYARSVEDARMKLEFDLAYIRERSIWTDLSIMSRTVPKMLGTRRPEDDDGWPEVAPSRLHDLDAPPQALEGT
jgi:lipopolysaccharide/colanic/teichoic acid biosynthesis glycosyltransferase